MHAIRLNKVDNKKTLTLTFLIIHSDPNIYPYKFANVSIRMQAGKGSEAFSIKTFFVSTDFLGPANDEYNFLIPESRELYESID